jgi:hypothetical protein
MVVLYAMISLLSCTNDKFKSDLCNEVSYSQTIKPLVNQKCAIAGCHVAGFQPGDFTNYEVLKEKVNDGKLQLVLFDLNIMPPVNKLSTEEKSLLRCWIESGAVSN